jgi:predicted Zn-dependent protease with MMP-like domain
MEPNMSNNANGVLHVVERMVGEERQSYLKKVDKELRQTLENIPVKVVLGNEKDHLYGDYYGTSYPRSNVFAAYETPSDITIYAIALTPLAQDEKALRKKVRLILMHEYGHYLGFSEEELRARGVF